MTFPGFPIGLPPLPADAQPLAEHHRAYVDALPAHKRHEAEWTLRSIDAAFARANKLRSDGGDRTHLRSAVNSAGRPEGDSLPTNSPLQDALRNESYREGLGCDGMGEAKKAAEHHWNCKRVSGGRR